jgi:hypothetical protein
MMHKPTNQVFIDHLPVFSPDERCPKCHGILVPTYRCEVWDAGGLLEWLELRCGCSYLMMRRPLDSETVQGTREPLADYVERMNERLDRAQAILAEAERPPKGWTGQRQWEVK